MNEVISRNNISVNDLLVYKQDTAFLRKVEAYRGEIRDKGVTFRLKARAQAEELLTTSWLLIHDPSVSPAVKADLIKSTVKWGGLEPKNDAEATVGGGGVRITINLGGQQHEATVIEHDDEVEDGVTDDIEE